MGKRERESEGKREGRKKGMGRRCEQKMKKKGNIESLMCAICNCRKRKIKIIKMEGGKVGLRNITFLIHNDNFT